MTHRKRAGFTLAELLVVIVTQAIGVATLVPAISQARSRAKQTVCATNLRGIGCAISCYQTTYASYPFIYNGKAMNPTAAPMEAMSKMAFKKVLKAKSKETHIIDNLLLLHFTQTLDNWKIWRCPSNPAGKNVLKRTDKTRYGFTDGKEFYIDYAMHNGYRYNGEKYNRAAFRDGLGAMPILADAPGKHLGEFQRNLEQPAAKGNDGIGYNHGQAGINCLYPDATVEWKRKVLCGAKDNNIYTVDLQRTGKPDGNTKLPTGKEEIQHRSDSVLIPIDIRNR